MPTRRATGPATRRPDDPRIRPVERGDLAGIAEIANAAIREGVAHFGTEAVGVEEFEAEWAGGQGRFPWLACVEEGRVVGYAKAGVWKPRGAYRWTTEIGIYLRPEAQGRGLGRALYERLFAELEARGFRTILAGLTVPNPASERLHESMGMTRCALMPRCGYKHGAWRDVAYYVKHVGGNGAPE